MFRPDFFLSFSSLVCAIRQDLTEKLDIYSLGNIFWAMLGRQAPFVRDDTYKGKVLRGERPMIDPTWHPEFVQVGCVGIPFP